MNTGSSTLACRKCGKSSTLKSNKGINEEQQRLAQGSLTPPQTLACPNPDCGSSGLRKFGKTRSGSTRYQCKECRKTFAVGKPTQRQRKPHKNEIVFSLIVNRTPIRRMCEVADLDAKSVYRKIDFIYRQCLKFAADRERRLCDMEFGSRYLCTDRQDYMVNWGDRREKKTMQLTAIATADQDSGYLFGLVPNFDHSILPNDLERLWALSGDRHKPFAMREYARLWTNADYEASARSHNPSQPARGDLDAVEDLGGEEQGLPQSGCQVHADYMMHGHYWLLRHHFRGAAKLRFSVDEDAGLIGACSGAFMDRIKDRTADIMVVNIVKSMTVDTRRQLHVKARAWFNTIRKDFPGMSEKAVKTEIMVEMIRDASAAGHQLNTHNLMLPFPDSAEPEKRVRYLTCLDDLDEHHTANLMLRATLWPVDTAFNQVRRRLSFCERGVTSVRRGRRLWHIYAPYEPAMLEKVLTIYRCWHNYVGPNGRRKPTPAQKLGLASGMIRMQDILYFS